MALVRSSIAGCGDRGWAPFDADYWRVNGGLRKPKPYHAVGGGSQNSHSDFHHHPRNENDDEDHHHAGPRGYPFFLSYNVHTG